MSHSRKPKNLADLLEQALDGCESLNTRRAYRSALKQFLDWQENQYRYEDEELISKHEVLKYVRWLQEKGKHPSSCNLALAAIRKLAQEASEAGLISAQTAVNLDAIKAIKRRGSTTGQWLVIEQAKALLQGHDLDTLKGLRDRVIFALLLECGLRREEAAALRVEQIQPRDGRPCIVNLVSKGGRTRTVPIPARAWTRIETWITEARIVSGHLLRPINKADELEEAYLPSMSASAIYKSCVRYTEDILGQPYKPHDLRRSFARLMRKHGAALDQIQQTLGHANTRTTQIYLGEYQDLTNAPCDAVDIEAYEATTKGDK